MQQLVLSLIATIAISLSALLPASAADGVAVVELFTSEGCSSCPPADRLVSRLAAEAREKSTPVVVIAYHVDYWDHLGWRDRFAYREFSALQQQYARHLGERRLFTPQIVVNGRSLHIGSDGPSVRAAIAGALVDAASVHLDLTCVRKPGRPALQVTTTITGPSDSSMVRVVAVERNLRTSVQAGENRGRTLRHDNVARSVASALPRNGVATVVLELPAEVDLPHTDVVAIAQDVDSLEIIGATAVPAPTDG
jgi:hypothetical protein